MQGKISIERLGFVLSAFITLIFSIHPLINPDGILYIETAKAFTHNGWQGAHAVYAWPFLGMLIAVTAKIPFLSYEQAALVLNMLFLGALAYFYIKLLKQLGASRVCLWLGLLLFLLHPTLNHYRHYIVRDIGFWALMLAAAYYFIQYSQTQKAHYLMAHITALLFATLFRIEGIIFILVMPFIVFVLPNSINRRALFAKLALLPAAAFVVGLITVCYHQPKILGRINDLPRLLAMISPAVFAAKAKTLTQELSPYFDQHDAFWFLLVGSLAFLVFKVIKSSFVPFLVFLFFVELKKINKTPAKIILFLFSVMLIILTAYLLALSFLTTRYVMLAVLLLMLFLPFGAEGALIKVQGTSFFINNENKIKVIMLVIAGLFFILTNYPFGPSQQYLKTAGVWLEKNIPNDAKLYTNKPAIRYYANRSINDLSDYLQATLNNVIKDPGAYDYLAVKIKNDNKVEQYLLHSSQQLQLLKQFHNNNNDYVYIFFVKKKS